MTLIGGAAAFVLTILGYKPNGKYGYCWVFEVGDHLGGASIGPVIITGKTPSANIMKHEHGHAIQNCLFGPLMPFIVCIPSVARYWYRELRYLRKGEIPHTKYDDVWFEGQATRIGTEFININYGG